MLYIIRSAQIFSLDWFSWKRAFFFFSMEMFLFCEFLLQKQQGFIYVFSKVGFKVTLLPAMCHIVAQSSRAWQMCQKGFQAPVVMLLLPHKVLQGW